MRDVPPPSCVSDIVSTAAVEAINKGKKVKFDIIIRETLLGVFTDSYPLVQISYSPAGVGELVTPQLLTCLMSFAWLERLLASQSGVVCAVPTVIEVVTWEFAIPRFPNSCDVECVDLDAPEPSCFRPYPYDFPVIFPRRRRSSLRIIPDSRLSRNGFRYGALAVMMPRFWVSVIATPMSQYANVAS